MDKKYERKTRTPQVLVEPDTHEKLTKIAQGQKLPMKTILGYLVDLCIKYDFLSEGWEARLKKALDDADLEIQRERPDLCPALAHTDKDGYVCCLNAPSQKKLGNGSYEDMIEVCQAHQRIKGVLDQNKLFLEQVKEGTPVKIPQCLKGGKLHEDGDKLYCPNVGEFRTPEVCQKSGCRELRFTTLTVKGILKDPSEMK